MLDARELLQQFRSGEAPACLPHDETIRARHYARTSGLDYDAIEAYFESSGVALEGVEVWRFPEGADFVYVLRRMAA